MPSKFVPTSFLVPRRCMLYNLVIAILGVVCFIASRRYHYIRNYNELLMNSMVGVHLAQRNDRWLILVI
jgi:hypothetical protein